MANRSVHTALCPRVAVLAGPDVDAIMRANDALHLADLLQPFEDAATQVTVRTSQLEMRACDVFPVRFDRAGAGADAAHTRADPPLTAALSDFMDAVQAHFRAGRGPLGAGMPIDPPPDAAARDAWRVQAHATLPWFSDVETYLYHYRPAAPFDSFSAPTAEILAASAGGSDPMNAFAHLYEASAKSAARRGDAARILRCYLVLHDTATAGADLAPSVALLEEVKATYGLQCALVQVNSASAARTDAAPSIAAAWAAPDARNARRGARADDGATPAGARLSDDDIARLRAYVRELVVKSLVPYLERNVQQLNEHVAALRGGLTGRLLGAGRKLFHTGRPANAPASGYDAQRQAYPSGSPVAETQRLADLAFHTRDYRLAAHMYELVRRDYAQDGATAHEAGAALLLGLTKVLGGGAPHGAASLLPDACDGYLTLAGGQLYALRAAMLFATVLGPAGDERGVADTLLRGASFADEVLRAVLLEQASRAYLRMPRPYVRRGAVTLLQSAEQYEACGQRQLAFHAYQRLAQFYEPRSWDALTDRVLVQLSRLAQNNGDADQAVAYLVRTLRRCTFTHRSADAAHLSALLTVYRYAGRDGAAPPRVQLPSGVFDVQASAIAWADDGGADFSMPAACLLHVLTPPPPLAALHADAVRHTVATVSVTTQLETTGRFRLDAITFRVQDTVLVEQRVEKRGARLYKTKEDRVTPTYATDTTLAVDVRDAVPRLQVRAMDPPSSAYAGETVRVLLRVENVGGVPVQEGYVAGAPARVRRRGASPEGGPREPRGADAGAPAYAIPADAPPLEPSGLSALAPGEHVEVPWDLHAVVVGRDVMRWLFVYRNPNGDTFSTRFTHPLQVHAALDAHVAARPSHTEAAYILAVRLHNCTDETLEVNRILLLSPQWAAEPIALHWDSLAPRAEAVAMVKQYMKGGSGARAPPPYQRPTHLTLACSPLAGRGAEAHGAAVGGAAPALSPHAYASARAPSRAAHIAAVYAFLPARVRNASFLLMDSNDVDVVVEWTMPHAARRGVSLLCGAHVGVRADCAEDIAAFHGLGDRRTSRDMYAETAQAMAAIWARLAASPLAQYPAPLVVDARADDMALEPGRAPLAPVVLTIRNLSCTWTLAYTLRLLPPATAGGDACLDAVWAGRTTRRGVVRPWSSSTLDAAVLVPEPGCYRLGAWACEAVLHGDDGAAVRTFSLQGHLQEQLVRR
ncbi:hypothetical protein MSPP1_001396 [Malassezia sp. CBS 17886]|nr:hypothetical protein MSPP1_001396 [Malassezia sp. CBS 17886]